MSEKVGGRESGKWRPNPSFVFVGSVVIVGGPVALASNIPGVEGVTGWVLAFLSFCFAPLIRVDTWLHWFPVLLVGVGVLWAVVRLVPAMWSTRQAIRSPKNRLPRLGEPLFRIAQRHNALTKIHVLSDSTAGLAFTAGLLRPRIYLAEVLQTELGEVEIEAVLLHELHHCRMYDPLRSVAINWIADVFFWIPLMRHGVTHLLARLEFAADDAARRCGDASVASAILQVARLSKSVPLSAVSFTVPELFERRVDRLLGRRHRPEVLPPAHRRIVARSALVLASFWFLGVASSGSHAAHSGAEGSVCQGPFLNPTVGGLETVPTSGLASGNLPVNRSAPLLHSDSIPRMIPCVRSSAAPRDPVPEAETEPMVAQTVSPLRD